MQTLSLDITNNELPFDERAALIQDIENIINNFRNILIISSELTDTSSDEKRIKDLLILTTEIEKKALELRTDVILEFFAFIAILLQNSLSDNILHPSTIYAVIQITEFIESFLELMKRKNLDEKIKDSEFKKIEKRYAILYAKYKNLISKEEKETFDTILPGEEKKHLSILIADDEEIIRSFLEDNFKELGHDVTTVNNGLEAIDKINNNIFDVVFTDIKMPGATGIQVLKHTKEVSVDTEVIVVTGYASVENAADTIHFGAYDYITKPFDQASNLEGLLNRITASIELKRQNKRLMAELQQRNRELKKNVSDLADALEEVKSKQKALIRADRMASLGVLAAGVAHEINNPTTFIRGNLQTLIKFWDTLKQHISEESDDPNDNEIKKIKYIKEEFPLLIKDMMTGTERISKIVSGLRTFVHPGEQEDFAMADIHICIEDALTLVHSQLKNNIEITRKYQNKIPKLFIASQKMTQVFVNLLVNAAHAMENVKKGSLIIETYIDGPSFSINIKDSGKGISPQYIDKIFDPFFTTKPAGKGTGLGLSIIHGIIKEHNGKITVSSEEGKGTTFTVILPLPEYNQSKDTNDVKQKVLIIDDDPQLTRIITMVLSKNNYTVESANGGFQGIYKIGEFKPDLVILDIRMPDMDGIDVIKNIRNNPNTKDLKIICITGMLSKALQNKLNELKIIKIVNKPFDPSELVKEIRSALKK